MIMEAMTQKREVEMEEAIHLPVYDIVKNRYI